MTKNKIENRKDTFNYFTPETPSWHILNPEINLKLSLSKLDNKDKINPEIYYKQFYEI